MQRILIPSGFVVAVLFTFTAFVFGCPQRSYADAPKDVKLGYNFNSQELAVTIRHPSSFPGLHHVKNVEIKKNGAVVSTNAYTRQPDQSPFTFTYKIEAAPGDTLEITATCNMAGNKTTSITVAR
jgi:subtilase family serine protease